MPYTQERKLIMLFTHIVAGLVLSACGGGGGGGGAADTASAIDATGASAATLITPTAPVASVVPVVTEAPVVPAVSLVQAPTPIPAPITPTTPPTPESPPVVPAITPAVLAQGKTAFAIAQDQLSAVTRAFGAAHEALADGVPLSFDWAQHSRVGQGNAAPAGFTAMTGWGQVFWQAGAAATDQAVEIRSNQTYVCSGASHEWSLLQQGGIEGAAFRPDFAGNEAVPANLTPVAAGQLRAGFPAARAFHYWPSQGRVELPDPGICGILVVFEARAVATDGGVLSADAPTEMLIGAGADYWLSLTAVWDEYRTNQDVGIGQLRKVTPAWQWFGLSTAAAADLQGLLRDGFVDRTVH